MNVIRENDGSLSIEMIDLFIHWNIRRCNVAGCKQKPNTIIGNAGDSLPVMGFCEEHYQLGNVPDGANFTLAFDDFDAFKDEDED